MSNGGGRPTREQRGISGRMTRNRLSNQPVAPQEVAKKSYLSKEFNWLERLENTRPTKMLIEVKYSGRGMLGKPPHRTDLGKHIWQFVQEQKAMQFLSPRRLGSCVGVQFERVCAGYKAATGTDLLENLTDAIILAFLIIAFTSRPAKIPELWKMYVKKPLPKVLTDPTGRWKVVLPANLIMCGVPGALAHIGKAKVVDDKGIWAGELEPGSPIQMWNTMDKRKMFGIGHAAVMERYVQDPNGSIVGLVYSDQWMDYRLLRKPGSWRWMFGARFL